MCPKEWLFFFNGDLLKTNTTLCVNVSVYNLRLEETIWELHNEIIENGKQTVLMWNSNLFLYLPALAGDSAAQSSLNTS